MMHVKVLDVGIYVLLQICLCLSSARVSVEFERETEGIYIGNIYFQKSNCCNIVAGVPLFPVLFGFVTANATCQKDNRKAVLSPGTGEECYLPILVFKKTHILANFGIKMIIVQP